MRFLGSCAGEGPARQTEAAESDLVFGRHGGPSRSRATLTEKPCPPGANHPTFVPGGRGASMSLFESTLRRWGRSVRGLPTLGIYVKIDAYLEF
jgi:hypothetical protein